jgi:hypothetical protein
MTYTKRVWSAPNGRETAAPSHRDMGNIDNALFDQDARITVLEAAVEDLTARIVVLEQA